MFNNSDAITRLGTCKTMRHYKICFKIYLSYVGKLATIVFFYYCNGGIITLSLSTLRIPTLFTRARNVDLFDHVVIQKQCIIYVD